ncbi:MAG: phospholipase D-like domain-containing protein [Candidatus Peribacteria bacterium]|nr:phospholipase D-like domain-containing protein [Candidatus Peribacteria bacterium]
MQQLLQDIEHAKKHIHMQYFIFRNDESGTKIKHALMKKAKEGIEVRFLYDNVGSFPIPARFYNEMKSAGVKVYPFLREKFVLKSRFNYRNHRKIVVIDGEIGYVGGMNVGNEYFCKGRWRDTHLRITGLGIYGLQSIFLLDWFTSGEKDISAFGKYFPPTKTLGTTLLQTVSGGPNLAQKNLMLATMRIANNAKQYLYIQTPYFLPPQSLLDSLKIAGL